MIRAEEFDWEEDRPKRHPWSRMVIYELHVRGFTRHPSANVDHPGTYRALVEKIPYLTELGITTIELMPMQEFNCQDNEVSWLDWALRERHHEIDRFAREMLAFRRAHPVLSQEAFYTNVDISWFDPGGHLPEWGDPGE